MLCMGILRERMRMIGRLCHVGDFWLGTSISNLGFGDR